MSLFELIEWGSDFPDLDPPQSFRNPQKKLNYSCVQHLFLTNNSNKKADFL